VSGELVHSDTKALDRFTTADHRIRGNRSKVARQRGLGQDHLHVAIDDATQLAYAELLPTQDAPACLRCLAQARRWFAQLGIMVTGVMSDNAKAYTIHVMRAALISHRIRHLRTKPYRPQTNGKAERFTQTALRFWAYKRPYRTSRHCSAALPDFLDCHNVERPHRSLGRIPRCSASSCSAKNAWSSQPLVETAKSYNHSEKGNPFQRSSNGERSIQIRFHQDTSQRVYHCGHVPRAWCRT
jgi:hypothetical protein